MWFAWSSGSYGPVGPHPSSRRGAAGPAVETAILLLPMPRFSRWSVVPRHAPTPTGATCGGRKFRSKSRLPGRSLLPSWPSGASPRLGPRGPSTGPLACTWSTGSRDPPDLGADFPDAFRSLRPGRKAGFPLLGLSKDRPSIVSIVESAFPGTLSTRIAAGLRAPFGMGRPIPILRAALVVSHHLGGLLLRDLAALLHAAADHGVHDVSPCRETGFPVVRLLPFEAFPPPTATVPGRIPVFRGLASPCRPSPVVTFTARLAPSPFLSHR
jgi:hypothetical protein